MTTTPRVDPILTAVSAAIKMPERNMARGSKSLYPFDDLTAVGMSFGVKNRTAKQLSSVISNANRKAKVNKTDESGAVVYKTKQLTGPDGSVSQVPTTEAEKVAGKHFYAVDATGEFGKSLKGTEHEGCKAVVFRDL